MDDFFDAYVTAALWSTSCEVGDRPDRSLLDIGKSAMDIDDKTLSVMRVDCEKFYNDNFDMICEGHGGRESDGTPFSEVERAGHDFWLTRNGHGAGFWDGDWPDHVEKRLDEAAKAFGEFDLYLGDDGKIYH